MKHFIYFAIAKAISQIKYRVFKKERVTKGAFQLSLRGYFCSVSLRDLRAGSMTYQPSGMDRLGARTAQTQPPPPAHNVSLSTPGTDISDAQPSPSPHNTTVLLITLQIPRDRRGCPVILRSACNPRTSQEVTAEEEQPPYTKTLKTNKARALKALSEHCEWKLQDYGSRWLHTYRTHVCLDAPHFQPTLKVNFKICLK